MTDTRGLHHKYTVRRTDRSDQPGGKHDRCSYFVLDLTHDAAARSILPALADAYEAHGRPELARDLRALSGVPGGGEPQPGTAAWNQWAFVGDLRARDDADRIEVQNVTSGRWHPVTSSRFDGCVIQVPWRLTPEPVRSAGGGDQPDTPCPHCHNGMVPAGGHGGDGYDPCPACTPSPEEG